MDVLTCSIDGCAKPVKARGWCAMHYWRWKKHGSTDAVRPYRTGRRIMDNGYVGVWAPGHPLAGMNGYAPEHRLVMFELGHDIAGKHVHHLDHDKTNNAPENLVVLSVSEHSALHGHTPNAGHFQRKTHCIRGHEFTPENTYTYGDGRYRQCYACKRARGRKAVTS